MAVRGPWSGAVPDVVIAEVWPSLYRLPPLDGRVRDEVQVSDRRPPARPHDRRRHRRGPPDEAVVAEEGWVLGA